MDKKEELQATSWEDSLDNSLLQDLPTDSDVSYTVYGTQRHTRETLLRKPNSTIQKDNALLREGNEGTLLDTFDTSRFESNWRAERELSLHEIKLQLERQHREQQRQLKTFQDTIEKQLLAAQERQVASLSMTSPHKSDCNSNEQMVEGSENLKSTLSVCLGSGYVGDLQDNDYFPTEIGLDIYHAVKSSPKTMHREETVMQPLQVDVAKRDTVAMFGNSTNTPEMLERARSLLREHAGVMVDDGNATPTESTEVLQEPFSERPSHHPLTPRSEYLSSDYLLYSFNESFG
jgi:hypothetical protein